jgi:hypothetical protein
MRRYFGLLATISVCLLVTTTHARGDVFITLNNASFEIQNPFTGSVGCSAPCYNSSIVDWNQVDGTSGTFDPSLGSPAFAPVAIAGNAGPNVAYLDSSTTSGAYITQDLGILTAGVTYDISIAVASRGGLPQALYRLGAATGGTATSPLWSIVDEVSGTAPANTSGSDNWSIVTLDFTPTKTADWYTFIADDGASNGSGSVAQLLVDDPPSVPEPMSLVLLASAIGFMAVFRRKLPKFRP